MDSRRFLIFAGLVVYIHAHGRMMDPPNRGSLWRFGYDTPKDLEDHAKNCGGFGHQHLVNGGKCGICGDPYNEPQPRAHELGGRFGQGHIVAHYEEGQAMTINIFLSAFHYGFWELRICPNPYHQKQECFNNYLLELEGGGTRYYPKKSGSYNVTYLLPAGLTCEHCVLQWQYTGGYNWGVCANGTKGLGCGDQEQFYSCADISIGQSGEKNRMLTESAPVKYSQQERLTHSNLQRTPVLKTFGTVNEMIPRQQTSRFYY